MNCSASSLYLCAFVVNPVPELAAQPLFSGAVRGKAYTAISKNVVFLRAFLMPHATAAKGATVSIAGIGQSSLASSATLA